MSKYVALTFALAVLTSGGAYAQGASGDTGVTTPATPGAGTALPHADEKMPSAGSVSPSSREYSSIAAAKVACGQDDVVWEIPSRRMFTAPTGRSFHKTAHGFYTCRRSAVAIGLTENAH